MVKNWAKWTKKLLSTKGLTEDLLNKYKVLNGAKYFSSGVLPNYLAFTSANICFKFFSRALEIVHGNLQKYQKKVLKK